MYTLLVSGPVDILHSPFSILQQQHACRFLPNAKHFLWLYLTATALNWPEFGLNAS